MVDNNFWAGRAQQYEQQKWVKDEGYLGAFLNAGDFNPFDEVLDVGTGTGTVAHAISPHVSRVIGIDSSPSMLQRALKQRRSSPEFLLGDVTSLPFASESFNRVSARMTFHHILDSTEAAISECYRVLKKDGKMVLSEGVPPDARVRDWYTSMFTLVERRLTFMEADLERLMRDAGFKDIETKVYLSRRCSVRDWLVKCGLPRQTQEAVIKMHFELEEYGKKAYDMVETDNDVLINMKFAIVTGWK